SILPVCDVMLECRVSCSARSYSFFLLRRRPPSTLFPYTTLFRSLRPPRRRYQNQLEYNLEAEHLWAVQHDAFRLALAAGLRRHGPDFGQWGEPRHGLGEHLQLHDRG